MISGGHHLKMKCDVVLFAVTLDFKLVPCRYITYKNINNSIIYCYNIHSQNTIIIHRYYKEESRE